MRSCEVDWYMPWDWVGSLGSTDQIAFWTGIGTWVAAGVAGGAIYLAGMQATKLRREQESDRELDRQSRAHEIVVAIYPWLMQSETRARAQMQSITRMLANAGPEVAGQLRTVRAEALLEEGNYLPDSIVEGFLGQYHLLGRLLKADDVIQLVAYARVYDTMLKRAARHEAGPGVYLITDVSLIALWRQAERIAVLAGECQRTLETTAHAEAILA